MDKKTGNFNDLKGAGLGGRFGAYLLDMLIISVIYGFVALIISVVSGFEDMLTAFLNNEFGSVYLPFKLVMVSLPIIWFVYSVILEGGKKESTWGKRAAKLRTVHISGQKVRGLDLIVRNTVKVLPMLIGVLFFDNEVISIITECLFIAYFIVPLCNKNHCTVHDFVSGTIVVKKSEVENKRSQEVIPELNIKLPSVEEIKASREGTIGQDKTVAPIYAKRKLVCVSGLYAGTELPLDGNIIMGRDSEKCDLIFDNDTKGVSRQHCCVEVSGGRISIVDLGSTYGTSVNGIAIKSGERKSLSIGDRIKLGKNEEFVVQ